MTYQQKEKPRSDLERGLIIFGYWRRGWDSNPRWLVTTLDFESSTFNRSDTPPQRVQCYHSKIFLSSLFVSIPAV